MKSVDQQKMPIKLRKWLVLVGFESREAIGSKLEFSAVSQFRVCIL